MYIDKTAPFTGTFEMTEVKEQRPSEDASHVSARMLLLRE